MNQAGSKHKMLQNTPARPNDHALVCLACREPQRLQELNPKPWWIALLDFTLQLLMFAGEYAQ